MISITTGFVFGFLSKSSKVTSERKSCVSAIFKTVIIDIRAFPFDGLLFKHSRHKRAEASGERQGDDLGTTPSWGKGLLGWRRRQEGPGLCREEPRWCGDRGEEIEDKRRRKGHWVTERCAEEEYHQRANTRPAIWKRKIWPGASRSLRERADLEKRKRERQGEREGQWKVSRCDLLRGGPASRPNTH